MRVEIVFSSSEALAASAQRLSAERGTRGNAPLGDPQVVNKANVTLVADQSVNIFTQFARQQLPRIVFRSLLC